MNLENFEKAKDLIDRIEKLKELAEQTNRHLIKSNKPTLKRFGVCEIEISESYEVLDIPLEQGEKLYPIIHDFFIKELKELEEELKKL